MADVVIIGAGPAGIFAALELINTDPGMKIVIIEQGNDIHERSRTGKEMLVGWGGAGAYSDGKLTISTDVGGQLSNFISDDDLFKMLEYVDELYTRYAPSSDLFALENDESENIGTGPACWPGIYPHKDKAHRHGKPVGHP
jgi:uncharacterized FAD-dependent dehydrogenase